MQGNPGVHLGYIYISVLILIRSKSPADPCSCTSVLPTQGEPGGCLPAEAELGIRHAPEYTPCAAAADRYSLPQPDWSGMRVKPLEMCILRSSGPQH